MRGCRLAHTFRVYISIAMVMCCWPIVVDPHGLKGQAASCKLQLAGFLSLPRGAWVANMRAAALLCSRSCGLCRQRMPSASASEGPHVEQMGPFQVQQQSVGGGGGRRVPGLAGPVLGTRTGP